MCSAVNSLLNVSVCNCLQQSYNYIYIIQLYNYYCTIEVRISNSITSNSKGPGILSCFTFENSLQLHRLRVL